LGLRERASATIKGLWAQISYLVAIATDFFYAKRFRSLQQRLGTYPDAGRRGFIAIQIDSLSYEHFFLALSRGYMPYVKRLIERGELSVQRYLSGLPSTTPAAQAGIMYGHNEEIPSFRWYERATGRMVVCRYPAVLREIRDRIATGSRGILEGGSSYVNLFDAGAEKAIFTVSSFGQSSFLHSIRGIGFFALFVISPIRPLRLLLGVLTEYVTHAWDRIKVITLRRPRVGFEGLFPLVRLVTAVVFRELQTFGVAVDIYRGVPRIYTTYNGYDEVAHHFGPESPAALKVLKGIDRQIKQIDSLRRHSPYVQYDLYLLSDHGQTPSVPFRKLTGADLSTVVTKLVEDRGSVVMDTGEEDDAYHRISFLLEELRYAERRAGRRKGRVLARVRGAVEKRLAGDEGVLQEPKGAIVVSASSSLAHVYFPGERKRDMSEVEAAYPGLIDALVKLKGVGLVVGCEGRRVIAVSRRGRRILGPAGRVVGEDPLHPFGDTEALDSELIRLAQFKTSGDLILFGEFEDGIVVAFEEHFGAHGSWGGPQAHAFLAVPARITFPSERVRNARELYPLFAAYLQSPYPASASPSPQLVKAGTGG
jgi:hypothetical protein